MDPPRPETCHNDMFVSVFYTYVFYLFLFWSQHFHGCVLNTVTCFFSMQLFLLKCRVKRVYTRQHVACVSATCIPLYPVKANTHYPCLRPVFTGASTYYPCSRAVIVCTTLPVFTAREHGPWTRAVCIGLNRRATNWQQFCCRQHVASSNMLKATCCLV